ncbi:hypothetical protein D3C81_1901580 [compost metagenome]
MLCQPAYLGGNYIKTLLLTDGTGHLRSSIHCELICLGGNGLNRLDYGANADILFIKLLHRRLNVIDHRTDFCYAL